MRPTPERVREALFSILGKSVSGARVLDLFAGSGALGIEAISRGAQSVCFVEHSRAVVTALRGNLERLGVTDTTKIVAGDVLSVLSMLTTSQYDLVLMDPPYGKGYVPRVLTLLDGLNLVSDCGTVVCELGESDAMPQADVGRLLFAERRVYGETALAFYDLGAVCAEDGP